jgi:peptide/nickel transport system ATP-binding protein
MNSRSNGGSNETPVLEIQHLAITYETLKGDIPAVQDVSFSIDCGETLGIVGESGCGKSSVAFGIVDFLGRNGKISGGSVRFRGQELRGMPAAELRRLCGSQISMVYQDPMQALNPALRVGNQLMEVLIDHQDAGKEEAREASVEMLRQVHMPDPEQVMERFPHQLSGGQQQRALIAMALLNRPALLIADEPTTALDVTVEATVLDLFDELRQEFETAIIYISHDMGVIARVADRVGVMYAGEIVELGPVRDIFLNPVHPYTQALIRCVPQLGESKATCTLEPIRGRVPSPKALPEGCFFVSRCDYAKEECRREHPLLRSTDGDALVRCHHAEDMAKGVCERTCEMVTDISPQAVRESEDVILETRDAKTYYEQEAKSLVGMLGLGEEQYVKALDGVDLEVKRGNTLGIVGESGCGKSTLARTIVGLERLVGGEIRFLDQDLSEMVGERDLELIREIQMVFQNPDSTLNPSYKVGHQISRPLKRFGSVESSDVEAGVKRLLHAVRLDESYANRYPRQLSGGEKQRVAVARALAAQPSMMVCDEPVSSLDVSVQAAVLNLLLDVQEEHQTTMLFIAHDLSVVRFFSDSVAVMYLGRLCEVGPADAIYAPPYHPYTEGLLSAVPIPDPSIEQKRIRVTGEVPSALNPPEGCRFHTRCPRKVGVVCEEEDPPEVTAGPGHTIYCHIPLDDLSKVEPVLT